MNRIRLTSFDVNRPEFLQVVKLYCTIHIGSNYSEEDLNEIKERMIRHSTYDGFTGFIAANESNRVIGFVYGYTSLPGQFYRTKLESILTTNQVEQWLMDCFEFVELAVHSAFRRCGIGSQLHDTLLSNVPNRVSILTTGVHNQAARTLYIKKGWQVINESAKVLPGGEDLVIMGKYL